MHAAHRLADDKLEMLDTEMLGQQAILRPHLIFIGEFREGHAQPVRGLR